MVVARSPSATLVMMLALAGCGLGTNPSGRIQPPIVRDGDATTRRDADPSATDGGSAADADTFPDAQADAQAGADAEAAPDAPAPPPDAGFPDASAPDASPPDGGSPGSCLQARLLWSDDFETGNFSRWTNAQYGFDTSNCNESMISNANAHSGRWSARAEVTCVKTGGDSHRPYGGIQFAGDRPLARYTNTGVGISAPNGVVTTQWGWLDVPYNFGNGRWFSHWTINNACDYSDAVMTLGVSDARGTIETAHVTSTGGTVRYAPNAPTMPLRQWVRTTVYISYVLGEMTVWMNGQKVMDASFSRRVQTMCQFHWGLYASPQNTDIEYYDDDISIHRLDQRLTDRDNEPWFGHTVTACP